jgi:hypothetical protein
VVAWRYVAVKALRAVQHQYNGVFTGTLGKLMHHQKGRGRPPGRSRSVLRTGTAGAQGLYIML